eukprot:COSAG01_NODE_500_length_16223_cov_42.586988_4_plen_211_part_00
MTVLSKYADAYDPLLFWKRLPDELLHKIADPLVRVKERHSRVMRELMFGPRRRCQQAFHSQWKAQWSYYSQRAPTPAPPLSRAYSMLRLLPYGVTPSGRRVRRRPIICAGDLQPRGIFRELLSPAMKILGISMDIYGLSALRFAQGTRHRDLNQAIQENGLRISKSLKLSVKKVAVYRAFRTSADVYKPCQCERCKARMAISEPPTKRRK